MQVETPFSEVAWFSEHLASFGTDVIVREPADLRDAVITQAEGSAGVTSARAAEHGSAGTSSDRLQRLLALVPYVVSRKVVGLAETAAAFGVSERELVDDLNMLWCVELRTPDPYCPIDLSYEGGEIVISQAEPMDRPLRLGVDEASALLVALRMLAEVGELTSVPDLAEGSALSRTIAKLEAAAGEAGAPSAQVAVEVDQHAEQQRPGPSPRGAGPAAAGLHLSYYVPGRDEATERDVDPMRLLVVEGRTYLEGWCRRAEAVRVFRLDRVLRHRGARGGGGGAAPRRSRWMWTRGCSGPRPADMHVVLRTRPARPLGGRVLPV